MINVQNRTEIKSTHPMDMAEHAVVVSEYLYKREGDCELHFCAPGAWGEHGMSFIWSAEHEILHLNLNFETKWPAVRHKDMCALVAFMNERLPFGHFDVWHEASLILYRSALLLSGGALLQGAQISAMIETALEAGDRFIPAFNFLVWGGKKPEEAVAAAMFDTVGQA